MPTEAAVKGPERHAGKQPSVDNPRPSPDVLIHWSPSPKTSSQHSPAAGNYRMLLALLLATVAVADTVRPAPRAVGPKVLIYVDMEGSSGVSKPNQVLYPNPEYFAHRRFITADLNAAIRGLKAGGAGAVADSYRFEIGYQNVRQTDLAGTIPGTIRLDSLTLGFTSKTFPEGYLLSNRMTGAAGFDRLRWLMSVVREQPNAKEILRQYLDRLVVNWLEPEKLPKPRATPARKRRYWGDT